MVWQLSYLYDMNMAKNPDKDEFRKEKRRLQQQKRRNSQREKETESERMAKIRLESDSRNKRQRTRKIIKAQIIPKTDDLHRRFNEEILSVVDPPIENSLNSFKKNPQTALLAFAVNSGFERYPALYLISIDSSEVGENISDTPSQNSTMCFSNRPLLQENGNHRLENTCNDLCTDNTDLLIKQINEESLKIKKIKKLFSKILGKTRI